MRFILLLALLAFPAFCADDWGAVGFLIGNWGGTGSGQPGIGEGSFSLLPDLQGHVLIRRNVSDYQAIHHEDLMVIFHDGAADKLRAEYFDNEGHVIRYTVTGTADRAVFLSDGAAGEIRYRLTYLNAGKDRVRITFEIAPPGKDFTVYSDGTVNRRI